LRAAEAAREADDRTENAVDELDPTLHAGASRKDWAIGRGPGWLPGTSMYFAESWRISELPRDGSHSML
jgi:hypothetical protein